MEITPSTLEPNLIPIEIEDINIQEGMDIGATPQANTPVSASDASNLEVSSNGTVVALGTIQSSNFRAGSNGWRLDSNGNLEANDGNFRGSITGASGTFSGTITAAAGSIGGWSINATSIYTGTEDHSGYTANAGDLTIYSDGTDASIHAKNFYIDTSGNLVCQAGTIGSLTISSVALYFDGATDALSAGIAPADYPFYAGKKYADRATAPFRVTPAGALTATSATITGVLTAGVGSSLDFTYVAGGTKPEDNADVTNTAETLRNKNTIIPQFESLDGWTQLGSGTKQVLLGSVRLRPSATGGNNSTIHAEPIGGIVGSVVTSVPLDFTKNPILQAMVAYDWSTDTSGSAYIILGTLPGDPGCGFKIIGGKIYSYYEDSGEQLTELTGVTLIDTDPVWNNLKVVTTHSAGTITMKFYVNGVLKDTQTTTYFTSAASIMTFRVVNVANVNTVLDIRNVILTLDF